MRTIEQQLKDFVEEQLNKEIKYAKQVTHNQVNGDITNTYISLTLQDQKTEELLEIKV